MRYFGSWFITSREITIVNHAILKELQQPLFGSTEESNEKIYFNRPLGPGSNRITPSTNRYTSTFG